MKTRLLREARKATGPSSKYQYEFLIMLIKSGHPEDAKELLRMNILEYARDRWALRGVNTKLKRLIKYLKRDKK